MTTKLSNNIKTTTTPLTTRSKDTNETTSRVKQLVAGINRQLKTTTTPLTTRSKDKNETTPRVKQLVAGINRQSKSRRSIALKPKTTVVNTPAKPLVSLKSGVVSTPLDLVEGGDALLIEDPVSDPSTLTSPIKPLVSLSSDVVTVHRDLVEGGEAVLIEHPVSGPSTLTSPAKPLVSLKSGVVSTPLDLVEGGEALLIEDPVSGPSTLRPLPKLPSTPKPTPIATPVVQPPIKAKPFAEISTLSQFVRQKSRKFGVSCELYSKPTEHAMSATALTNSVFEISINSLYLLSKKDIDIFLQEKPAHAGTIKKFLTEKNPTSLNQAASDLVDWFNKNGFRKVTNNDDTQLLAKELLIMHSLGKLDDVKRFLLTHELGHAHDHNGTKSIGHFEPAFLPFIKSHQYNETRADLTAARELNAHLFGKEYFEWRDIIAGQPADTDSHPTDANRAKAIYLDYLDKTSIPTT